MHYAPTSNSMATSVEDAFMPKDNTVTPEDGEMNEIDQVQTVLPDDQTTEGPSKGCCASEPEGP